MHEYSVTKGLLKMALDEAKRAGAEKIVEIRIVIGDLSTVIDESVQMYFDMMSEGTAAEGARLVFRRVAAQFECRSCGIVFDKPSTGFDCPQCGSMGFATGVGKEFYMESLEVE